MSSLCAATVERSVAHARTELRRVRERAVGRPEVRRGHRRTPDDTPASSATGLPSAEAARRLTRHGPNAIPKEPRAPRVAAGAATTARSADPGAVGGRRLDDRHR
ncbi:cation-transporting P-type ATPase [Streptomyces sp. DSM 116494]|uniref:cation-transporting P-type ATPase n=1 Tax=Streptomyces okerensis TaxID=3344655 RepID=UPI00388DBD86